MGALQRIVESDRFAVWNAEAPVAQTRFTGTSPRIGGGAERGRKDGLSIILGVRGGEASFDILAGLVAWVDGTRGLELLPDRVKPWQTLRLDVGGVWAADVRTFRPLQAEPAEVFDRRGGEFGPTAAGIQIFGAVE